VLNVGKQGKRVNGSVQQTQLDGRILARNDSFWGIHSVIHVAGCLVLVC
jgi:hypothetical protein